MPIIFSAIKCSLVCGWGHDSLAAITSTAPSIIAAPESIVAMRVSCPGESTKETVRTCLVGEPSTSHTSFTV